MDGTVDAAPPGQLTIGCIHNCVDVLLGNVTLEQLEADDSELEMRC